jgi:hypothetical protein
VGKQVLFGAPVLLERTPTVVVSACMQYVVSSGLVHTGWSETSVVICAQWDGFVVAFAFATTDDVVDFDFCIPVAEQSAANTANVSELVKTASVLGR